MHRYYGSPLNWKYSARNIYNRIMLVSTKPSCATKPHFHGVLLSTFFYTNFLFYTKGLKYLDLHRIVIGLLSCHTIPRNSIFYKDRNRYSHDRGELYTD